MTAWAWGDRPKADINEAAKRCTEQWPAGGPDAKRYETFRNRRSSVTWRPCAPVAGGTYGEAGDRNCRGGRPAIRPVGISYAIERPVLVSGSSPPVRSGAS